LTFEKDTLKKSELENKSLIRDDSSVIFNNYRSESDAVETLPNNTPTTSLKRAINKKKSLEIATQFIKPFESLQLKSYQCEGGVWTIG
jgi:hypothetical protein